MNFKGQGALEYLLLLAAAVIVVAVVISFMIGTIRPVEETGNQQTLDFTCKTLDSNSLLCGCYLCEKNRGGYDDTTQTDNVMAGAATCQNYYIKKNNPLLNPTKCSGKPGF